jgi:LCP family protein required for cell wall assembly
MNDKKKKKVDFKNNKRLLIAAISFLLMLIAFLYNKFLPPFFEVIIIITAAAGVLLIALDKIPKSIQIIGIVLMLLGSLGLFYSQSALNRALSQIKVEQSIVSFVVLKDSTIENLSQGDSYKYGISLLIETELKNHALNEVNDKFKFNILPLEFNTDIDLYLALQNKQIDVMILDNAMSDFIEDEHPDFWDEVRVVFEVSKKYDRTEIKTDTNFKKDPFVVYLSGIDTKGPISTRSRSDVNILMYINPNTQEILQVTLPRDLYLPIACKNNVKDKLTHAGNYGINCSIDTIEQFMGHQIDLFARVNFTSFMNIVKVIGPIEVYSEYAFSPRSLPGYYVKQGINTMNAEQALAFSRERYRVPGGDVTRGLNQQEVIKGIIKKLISPAALLNIEGIVKEVAKSVDTNATSDNLVDIINRQIKESIDWKFSSMSMVGTGKMMPGVYNPDKQIYYMIVDQEKYVEIKAMIKEVMKK